MVVDMNFLRKKVEARSKSEIKLVIKNRAIDLLKFGRPELRKAANIEGLEGLEGLEDIGRVKLAVMISVKEYMRNNKS